jgi:hypothetical protein
MNAYGAVAPSATLRSADVRSSKSNGKSFLTIVAGVIVLGGCLRRPARALCGFLLRRLFSAAPICPLLRAAQGPPSQDRHCT